MIELSPTAQCQIAHWIASRVGRPDRLGSSTPVCWLFAYIFMTGRYHLSDDRVNTMAKDFNGMAPAVKSSTTSSGCVYLNTAKVFFIITLLPKILSHTKRNHFILYINPSRQSIYHNNIITKNTIGLSYTILTCRSKMPAQKDPSPHRAGKSLPFCLACLFCSNVDAWQGHGHSYT